MQVTGAGTGLVVLASTLAVSAGSASARPGVDAGAAARCDARLEVLETGTASSAWPDGTLGVVVPIANERERLAKRVVVTRVRGAKVLGRRALPARLGAIGRERVGRLALRVRGRKARRLVISGRYRTTCRFELDADVRPARGARRDSFEAQEGRAVVQRLKEAKFPEPQRTSVTEPNAESPILIPPGPPRRRFEPTREPSRQEAPGASALVDVDRNLNSTSTNAGFPPDPNAARDAKRVVLATFNTGISFSTDGGATFTDVGLTTPVAGQPSRTTFFPESDGGVCCDQVVVYLPKQDLFVWLLQYWPVASGGKITQPNRLRIAWARPQAIVEDFDDAWTYADLTATNVPGVSSGLGAAANEHLDYPDLAFSGSRLYVGVDRGFPDSPGSVYAGRRIVARLDLGEMADPGASVIHYQWIEYTGSNGLNKSHFVQGAGSRMVLGSLDDESTLRVFTWRDGSGSAHVDTTGISSITTRYTSKAPDGTDWYAVGFPGNITGATAVDGRYVFAFDGGVDRPDRKRAYVRLETVTPDGDDDVDATDEYDVWNEDYAYGMAALGTQRDGLGMGLAVGGGTVGFPQFAVGYKDDFVVYTVTGSTATQTDGAGNSRFGDYFSVRPIPSRRGFAAETYDVLQSTAGQTCKVGGCSAVARYVEFRRASP